MDHDTFYHVLDRFLAVPGMGLELWKIACLWQYGRTHCAAAYQCLNLLAIYSFLQSQEAQSKRDVDSFILWHNRWHL
jgi:hypothetical protein